MNTALATFLGLFEQMFLEVDEHSWVDCTPQLSMAMIHYPIPRDIDHFGECEINIFAFCLQLVDPLIKCWLIDRTVQRVEATR